MKRLSLKATSLILALVLALSLSVTAFADDNAASMTRAEVTQEVIKNMGLAAQAEASAKDASAFKDVAEGSKFEGAINLAYSKGIVNGVSKDAFAPDAAVTQLEAAAMILRSTGLDKALLKDWPADYDDMAVWSGLMDGLTYEASKPVTTAMLEQMLKNAAAIAEAGHRHQLVLQRPELRLPQDDLQDRRRYPRRARSGDEHGREVRCRG